jgi:CheY-like chemotaxis protein
LVLEAEGAAVTAVGSASEALAALSVRRPDVLVSDIAMPETDGYALMARLRAQESAEGGRRIPALALSAYARDEDRRRAIDAGFEVHVAKPVDPAKLAEVLIGLARGSGEGRRGEQSPPRRGGDGK